MQQRIKRHPFLSLFNGADPNSSAAERTATITPLQALFAMNDPFVHEQAERFAVWLCRERVQDKRRIELAYEFTFGRTARPEEIREGETYLKRFREKLRGANVTREKCEQMSWASYTRALLGSNEFIFVE
jgi:hypothetical protein